VDHGAVELEGTRYVGLAAEDLHQTLCAIHSTSLKRQTQFDNPPSGARRT